MSLTVQQHIAILHNVYQRLEQRKQERRIEFNNLRYSVPTGEQVNTAPIQPKGLTIKSVLEHIRAIDREIKYFERQIEKYKNPEKPIDKMTDEEKFSQAIGIAMENKLDMSVILSEVLGE